jgi:threonine synthase
MGLELAEQLGWTLPDVILYPTGGGTGLIGMWKAFAELREMGWLKSDKLPRMVSVQSDGCAPIVRAFEKGDRFAPLFENAHTVASGLRVPVAVGDFMILDAVRESGGTCIAVADDSLISWMARSTAACIAAADQLRQSGWIKPTEKTVIFNCAAGQKYPHLSNIELPVIEDPGKVDFEKLAHIA